MQARKQKSNKESQYQTPTQTSEGRCGEKGRAIRYARSDKPIVRQARSKDYLNLCNLYLPTYLPRT